MEQAVCYGLLFRTKELNLKQGTRSVSGWQTTTASLDGWARNAQLTISGYSPVELATGRRPPDQLDLELLTPEQLSTTPLRADETIAHLRRLSIKSHLEVRQNQDIKRDLARRLQPSGGPFEPGERVFVWIQDSSKFKDRGRWELGRVVGQEGL
eukprot:6491488-Amphidinium_carterae.3